MIRTYLYLPLLLCSLISLLYISCTTSKSNNRTSEVSIEELTDMEDPQKAQQDILGDIDEPDEDKQAAPKPPENSLDQLSNAALSQTKTPASPSGRFEVRNELYETPWLDVLQRDSRPFLSTAEVEDNQSFGSLSDIKEDDFIIENRFIKVGICSINNAPPMLPSGGHIIDITPVFNSQDELRSIHHLIKLKGKRHFIKYTKSSTQHDQNQVIILIQGHILKKPHIKITTQYVIQRNNAYIRIYTTIAMPGDKLPNSTDVELEENIICPNCTFHVGDNDHEVQNSISDVNSLMALSNQTTYHYQAGEKPFSIVKKNSGAILVVPSNSGPKPNSLAFSRRIWVGDGSFSPRLMKPTFGQITGFLRQKNGRPLALSNLLIKNFNGKLLTIAKTDEEGFFNYLLPTGVYKIQSDMVSNSPQSQSTFRINPLSRTVLNLTVQTSTIQLSVFDTKNRPIAFKAMLVGKKSTPNPHLHTSSGLAFQNLVYVPSGEAEVVVPPGIYRLIISHGMFYSHCENTLVISSGKTIRQKCRLKKEVKNPKYQTMDLSLFTSRSFFSGTPIEDLYVMAAAEQLNLISFPDIEYSEEHQLSQPPTFPEISEGITVVSSRFGVFSFYQSDLSRNEIAEFKSIKSSKTLSTSLQTYRTQNPDILIAYSPYSPVFNKDTNLISPSSDIYTQIDFLFIFHHQNPTAQPSFKLWHALLNRNIDIVPLASSLTSSGNPPPGLPLTIFNNTKPLTLINPYKTAPVPFSNNNNDSVKEEEEDPITPLSQIAERKNVTLSNGPFIDLTVNNRIKPGGVALIKDGGISVKIKVSARKWMRLKQIKIILNGKTFRRINIPSTRRVFTKSLFLPLKENGWFYAIVEGERFNIPLLAGKNDFPLKPFAFTNAIFLEAGEIELEQQDL